MISFKLKVLFSNTVYLKFIFFMLLQFDGNVGSAGSQVGILFCTVTQCFGHESKTTPPEKLTCTLSDNGTYSTICTLK